MKRARNHTHVSQLDDHSTNSIEHDILSTVNHYYDGRTCCVVMGGQISLLFVAKQKTKKQNAIQCTNKKKGDVWPGRQADEMAGRTDPPPPFFFSFFGFVLVCLNILKPI